MLFLLLVLSDQRIIPNFLLTYIFPLCTCSESYDIDLSIVVILAAAHSTCFTCLSRFILKWSSLAFLLIVLVAAHSTCFTCIGRFTLKWSSLAFLLPSLDWDPILALHVVVQSFSLFLGKLYYRHTRIRRGIWSVRRKASIRLTILILNTAQCSVCVSSRAST